MEMYRDSYVLALMLDGKIQKESDDGSVLIPFGSEYVLRLKNKLRKRAVADVWIDGKVAAKGIVIDANGTVDLERFVADGNLSEGKRFKLARLTDPKVDQPDDSENGSIEVNFYPEKDEPVVEKTIIHEYKHNCLHHHDNWLGHCKHCCNNGLCNICHPFYYHTYTVGTGGGITITGGLNTGDIKTVNVGSSINLTSNTYSASVDSLQAGQVSAGFPDSVMPMNASMNVGEAAATVEGSTSLQKFSSIYIDVDRSKSTTIRLLVKGLSKVLDKCDCGYKRKKDVKFCPNDGNQLVA